MRHNLEPCGCRRLEGPAHWMILVSWNTIEGWKDGAVRKYPFQYATGQARLKRLCPDDVLWVTALPHYRGYCSAPAVMARLTIDRVYDLSSEMPPVPVDPNSDHENWQYLALARRTDDIDLVYPPLYPVFHVIQNLKTVGTGTGFDEYRSWLTKGEFGTRGPFGRLARPLRLLQHLTPESGRHLDEAHQKAHHRAGVFLSYRWADIHKDSKQRRKWIEALVDELDRAGYLAWWDHEQLPEPGSRVRYRSGLLEELLTDGIRQTRCVVALATPTYAALGSWSAKEWMAARDRIVPSEGRAVRVMAVDLDGDLSRLGDDIVVIQPARQTARGVGRAIVEELERS